VTGPGPARPGTRVLIVSAYAPPHLGGVEVIVAQQAQTLAALGLRVTVVTSRCGGGARRERRDGYDIVRVSAWNVLERRLSVPFPLWSPAALLTIAGLAAKADIVHVHDAYHASSVLAALSATTRAQWRSSSGCITGSSGRPCGGGLVASPPTTRSSATS
jgi:D-inositol-3-phosphate glycosyltransferase